MDKWLIAVALIAVVSVGVWYWQNPGCLRRFASPETLAWIDELIEERDARRNPQPNIMDSWTEDEPENKRLLTAEDRPGDGSVWVLTDDGEIVELDQLQ